MGNFISRSWGAMEDEAAPPTRAMGDEAAPPTLMNRAAQPGRGYQPEPGIDAALGGAFNTSGKSNLPAEEVNEVTDTEDEDQELTPPWASANDREEQTEAPHVQSQGQTLGEHDHEMETVAAAAGDQAAAQEAADALRHLLLRPCPAVETVASGATPSPTPLCGAALAAENKERDYTEKMYAVMMVTAWCIFGAIFVGFVYTFILRIPRFLALVVWAIVVPVGAIWLAHLIGKVENENKDDGHRIQYSIVRRFGLVLSETMYKQKVYETEEAARKAWKKEGGCYSSVMFKLWVGRSGLVRYKIEDSYGTVAATNDIKAAFKKDSEVGLDTSHSNVKWTRCADVGTVIGIVGAVYFVGTFAARKLSELYSKVPESSPVATKAIEKLKSKHFRNDKYAEKFWGPKELREGMQADHIVECQFASWAANQWQNKNERELPREALQFMKNYLINSKRNGKLLPKALHQVKTTAVKGFFSKAKKPLPEDIRASMLDVHEKFEKITKRRVNEGTLDSENAKIVMEVLGFGKEKIGQ